MALITIKIERPVLTGTDLRERGARRRKLGIASVGALTAAAFLVNPFSASASVVPIPPHSVWNTIVAANAKVSPLASGGGTTVPTDATRVQFSVSATNEQRAGQLIAYPTGNVEGTSGHVLTFAAKTPASTTFTELVGLGNKVTFWNQSPGTITLSVKITGYSTEVRASDMSGAGGNAGDVLTNTGSGAAWQPAGRAGGHAWAANNLGQYLDQSTTTVLATLTLPSGNFVVSYSANMANIFDTVIGVSCGILTPETQTAERQIGLGGSNAGGSVATMSGQALISTAGGAVKLFCGGTPNHFEVFAQLVSLIAIQVQNADGDVN